MSDRTYVRGVRVWHAILAGSDPYRTSCGWPSLYWAGGEQVDRLPPAGHFCGRCSRSVAARTDVEEDPTYGNQVAPV